MQQIGMSVFMNNMPSRDGAYHLGIPLQEFQLSVMMLLTKGYHCMILILTCQ